MQRWLSTLLGLAAFGLAVAVVVRTMSDRPLPPRHETAVDAGVVKVADAGKPADAAPASALPLLGDLRLGDGGLTNDIPGPVVGRFPDGRLVPPLPDGSPKHVRLGIVLMAFAGAQGAPPNARPKREAADLATKLAQDAKTDFHAAVIRGDSGSSDDVGRLPRGILEPSVEYMVFTLPVGAVSEPIETPRGYWIAKRTE